MQNAEEAAEIKKKRTFRKFSYRGIDLDQYVAPTPRLSDEQKTSSGITTAALATPQRQSTTHLCDKNQEDGGPVRKWMMADVTE